MYVSYWLSYYLWFAQASCSGARLPTQYRRGPLLGACNRHGICESGCAWHLSSPPKLSAHRPCLPCPRAKCSACACAAGAMERGIGWQSNQRKKSREDRGGWGVGGVFAVVPCALDFAGGGRGPSRARPRVQRGTAPELRIPHHDAESHVRDGEALVWQGACLIQ
jgi:hypothetical protein